MRGQFQVKVPQLELIPSTAKVGKELSLSVRKAIERKRKKEKRVERGENRSYGNLKKLKE